MIITKPNEEYFYNGISYYVGDEICVTDGYYKGLFGVITAIRDGEDKVTKNPYTDFCCKLELPAHPTDKAKFEKRFYSPLGDTVTIDSINLEDIILSDEQFKPMHKKRNEMKIYLLITSWQIGGDAGEDRTILMDKDHAKALFNHSLSEELKSDVTINKWNSDNTFYCHITDNYFECGKHGENGREYYSISLQESKIYLSDSELKRIGEKYIDLFCSEVFYEQICDWEEFSDFTDKEIYEITRNPDNVQKIKSALQSDENLTETWSNTISEKSFEIVDKITTSKKAENS